MPVDSIALIFTVAAVALASLLLSPKSKSLDSFYGGKSDKGIMPSLLMLTLSQVTTWIFARSLLNAAILGFYYGIWGTIAYAAYYLSFFTGGLIVNSLRQKQGFNSVQAFLIDRFGQTGQHCYNFVIALRLISEVFANILVIAILFGAAGSTPYTLAVVGFALVSLSYSMLGGLRASLRTDVLQMVIFLAVLIVLMVITFGQGLITLEALSFKEFVIDEPGPVLLAVALLQVLSYPMHDPVMMDRGFIADQKTTNLSFIHAGWISILCILAFGSLGVIAGANAQTGQSMTEVLKSLLGTWPFFLFNAALVISAMSTLDSTLSSSAKLVVKDMGVIPATLINGRMVMSVFMLLGVGLVFLNNKDLFAAVAVSGTASMYLIPVIIFSLWLGRTDVPVWSYLVSFIIAISAAVLYFTESSGHTALLGDAHKYTKLLWLCLAVIGINMSAFMVGIATQKMSTARVA
jgi:Na+/proline symporter